MARSTILYWCSTWNLLLMVSLNYSVSIKSLWQFVLIAHSTFSRPYRHTLLSTRPIVLCKYRHYGILCVQPLCVRATWGCFVDDTLNHFESMQTPYWPYEKFVGNTEFSLWGCSWCIWWTNGNRVVWAPIAQIWAMSRILSQLVTTHWPTLTHAPPLPPSSPHSMHSPGYHVGTTHVIPAVVTTPALLPALQVLRTTNHHCHL